MRGLCVIASFSFLLITSVLAANQQQADPRPRTSKLFQIEEDPFGGKDSFEVLTDGEKQFWAKQGLGKTTEDYVSQLLEQLEVTTAVELKLVGFDGDGAGSVRFREGDFSKYIAALRPHPDIHVLQSEPHSLLVRNKVLFHVTKAHRGLGSKLWRAVADALAGTPNEQVKVPASVIDQILSEDQRSQDKLIPTIYLLNIPPQRTPYFYSYSEGGCSGSLFVSKERFLWVDLAAGPAEYGPMVSGEGAVLPTTVPRPENYPKGPQPKGFVADLVSLAESAVEHLLAPALDRFPVDFAEDLEMRLIHIKDTPVEGTELLKTDLDWTALEALVKEELMISPLQRVRFTKTSISLNDCEYCVAAFTRSIKSATTPNGYGISVNQRAFREGLATVYWDYIDSKELHYWLRSFYYHIMTELGMPQWASHTTETPKNSKVVPVYLFDLGLETSLLLDRQHQAVPFDDMIVAVRNKVEYQPLDFACNGMVSHIKLHQVTRPLLAAILQTTFGIAPTHLTWSPLHNRTEANWLWAIGPTPFGPLSASPAVSFAQKDAAARNVVLTQLNATVGLALAVLENAKEYGGAQGVLGSKEQVEYAARFAVLKHKLGRCTSSLSLYNFKAALYFALSAMHDVSAMHSLLEDSSQQLSTSLDCYTDPPFPVFMYASLGGLLVLAVYGWRQREKMQSKRKRF